MKRILSSLLIAILLIVQLTPNIPMVYAQEVNVGDVTYTEDQTYNQESNTTSITVKAQPGFDGITVDSITNPDGESISGSEVTYVATANGKYLFTIAYTSQTENDESITSGAGVTLGLDVNQDQKTLDIEVEVTDIIEKTQLLAEGEVAINESNFPDSTFRKYVGKFDGNGNGSFDQTELDSVREIRENGDSLSFGSLEGIQYFTKITVLFLQVPQMKELDLSYNTDLKELAIGARSLITLNISGNTALKELEINAQNLESLDVSNNTNLEVFSMMNTPIKTLDLTKNVELKELSINADLDMLKLRTLDLSKNEKLTDLRVRYTKISGLNLSNNSNLVNLNLDMNHLKKLDVSHNNYLKTLICDQNQLKELIVDGNNELVELSANYNYLESINLKNTKALEKLNLADNQLSELDLSENSALKSLGLDSNQLIKLDVSNLKQLEALGCANNQLTTLNISQNTLLTTSYLIEQQVYNKNIWVETDSGYEFDMKKLVGKENLAYIISIDGEERPVTYDAQTGIITANEKVNFIYQYDTQAKEASVNDQMDVLVTYSKLYSINAIAEGNGTITPPGVTRVEEGQDQEYKITPDTGSIIDQLIVNGEEVTLESPFIYTFKDIRNHQTIEVVFKTEGEEPALPKEEYYIYAGISQLHGGAESDGGTISSPGVTTIEPGDNKTYDIYPKDGMKLDYLLIDNVRTEIVGHSYTFESVTQNHRIEVVFASTGVEEFNIEASATEGGTITGPDKVDKGASPEYIITPADGYRIHEILVDNVPIPNTYYYTFQEVTKNHEIRVSFAEIGSNNWLAISEENFPDEDFRRYVRTFDNINNDGVLDDDELAAVTNMQIKLTTEGTHNLEGIDNFTNLTELSFSSENPSTVIEMDLINNKNLVKLDLSGVLWPEFNVKSNTKLKELYTSGDVGDFDLSKNTLLEKLTCNSYVNSTMDLRKNVELKELNLTKMTGLAQLDLRDNTKLEELNIAYMKSLAKLDFGKNTALKELTITETSALAELDLHNNSALEKVKLESNYNLTTVNTDDITTLQELICTENSRLSNVDLSGNTALLRLDLPGNFTKIDVSKNEKLEEFSCQNGKLSELILGNNTKLKVLKCVGNPLLTSINLEECRAIELLDLGGTDLTTLDVSQMEDLKELRCNNTQLQKLDVTQNKKLESLDCYDTKIRTLNLLNNTALKFLNCMFAKLTELDVSNNILLEKLYCSGMDISVLDVSKCPELNDLYCMGNKLTRLDVSNNPKLTSLACGQNQLTKLDVSKNILLYALECSENQLTKLELKNNMALSLLMPNPQKISRDKPWIKKAKAKAKDIEYEFDLGAVIGKENLKDVKRVIDDLDEPLKFNQDTGIITSSSECEFSYIYDYQLANIYLGADLMEVSVRLPGAYSIYAITDSNGSITPAGETRLKEGLSQSYTIKANAGYELDQLLIDGRATTPVSSYTFKKIYEDHTIEAIFKRIEGEPIVPPGGGDGGNGGGPVDPPVTPPVDPPVTPEPPVDPPVIPDPPVTPEKPVTPPVNPGGGGGDNGGGTIDPPVTPPGGGDNGGGTITPPTPPTTDGGNNNGGTITPPVIIPAVDNNTETIIARGNNNRNFRHRVITAVGRPFNPAVGKTNQGALTATLQRPMKEGPFLSDLNILAENFKNGNGSTQHPGFGGSDRICILHILLLIAALILTIIMFLKRKKDKEEEDEENEEMIQTGYGKA